MSRKSRPAKPQCIWREHLGRAWLEGACWGSVNSPACDIEYLSSGMKSKAVICHLHYVTHYPGEFFLLTKTSEWVTGRATFPRPRKAPNSPPSITRGRGASSWRGWSLGPAVSSHLAPKGTESSLGCQRQPHYYQDLVTHGQHRGCALLQVIDLLWYYTKTWQVLIS